MTDPLQIVKKALYDVANEYAEASNNTTGHEMVLYGEICDALRRVACAIEDEMRSGDGTADAKTVEK